MHTKFLTMGVAAIVVAAAPAGAKTKVEPGVPTQIQRLIACRATPDAAQRLACFDRETATVERAFASKDLVMIDKERAQAARRSVFGFSVPNFGGLLGGGDQDEVKQIEGVVASAGFNRNSGWTIRLADGSVWTQTDDTTVALEPKAGHKVVVRRAALGSFFLRLNGKLGFRVKRIG